MKHMYLMLWMFFLSLSTACGQLPHKTTAPVLPVSSPTPQAPYTGPVKINFDTGLTSPVLDSYGYRKSQPAKMQTFSTEDTFHVQAVPEGPVVFQETFNQGAEPLNIERTFPINDPQKKYTLHLQNGDAQGQSLASAVTIRINGYRWVQPADFANETPITELEKTDLVLAEETTLQLQLEGLPDSQVTLTLVESGAAGVIRRVPTQASASTGQTLFDPDNPNSLGTLEPFVQIPVSEDGRSLPTFSLNDGVPATISAGELLLKVRPPVQQNLNQILQQYNGKVIDEINSQEFHIQVDLDTVGLKTLPANLRALNALVDGNTAIQSVTFDSSQGAKMFALMVELLLSSQQGELVEAVDVNPVLFSNATRTSYEGIVTHPEDTFLNNPINAQDSWWLKQTGVLDAWNHSMGFQRMNNRPVRVAVVDSDFTLTDEAIKEGQDLQGQILTTRMATVTYDSLLQQGGTGKYSRVLSAQGINNFFVFEPLSDTKTAHGTSQASTIASNLNNGTGVVGVAPHAKIIPIKIGSFLVKKDGLYVGNTGGLSANLFSNIVMGWDLRIAIQAAGTLQADIVSITSSTVSDDIQNWLNNVNTLTTGSPYGWLDALQHQVDIQAQANRLICVFNAGNMGNHVRNTLPAGRLKNIVIAGAVSENTSRVPPFERALFFNGIDTENYLFNNANLHANHEAASAWWTGGNSPSNLQITSQIAQWENTLGLQNLKIWAPGDKMGALDVFKDKQDPHDLQSPIITKLVTTGTWGGTSAATPFTAGVLALLKSLHPNLTVPELLTGNWIKYKTIMYTDNMLKDFYAQGINRQGLRVSPFNLNVSVIDAAATLANASLQSPTNQVQEFVGTLRKGANNQPYLEMANGSKYDLAMFVEEDAFHTSSTQSQDARLKALSAQLKQSHYQVFWNTTALGHFSAKVRNVNLLDSWVRLRGWAYQTPNDSNYPQKIEVADVIKLTTEPPSGMSILSTPPDNLPVQSYVYDRIGNRWLMPGQTLTVHSHEFVGIRFSEPIQSVTVKIGPVTVPIIDILENLAVIGIPDDLPAGIHDAIITASGQTLTLEQVVQKASETLTPYVEPPHVPPSNDPGHYKTVSLFNVSGNDEARAYLNDQLIGTARAGEDISIQMGPDSQHPLRTDQRNEVRLELHSQGDGYTYGFAINTSAGTILQDIQGDAASGQMVRTQDGAIDNRSGQVYTERIWLHNTGIIPVGSGDLWVKVYNLGEDEDIQLGAYNEIGDIQWSGNQFLVRSQYQTFYRKLPWSPNICGANLNCWCTGPFCWTDHELQFQVFNQTGSYSYGIDIYKGIYLLYRNRDGQPHGWGANSNDQSLSEGTWSVYSDSKKIWKQGELSYADY